MAGIISYGAYVPIYRLSHATIGQVWGGMGKGEKAIANEDEDSLTLGVEAGRDCLRGMDRSKVDALFFASTTFPFKEKQTASLAAAALDLREDITAVDVSDSLRGGTIALSMALDRVNAGSARTVLVVVADCRFPFPNSALEPILGDGAAAFLIGKDNVIADIESSAAITSEFIDSWRLDEDKGVRVWEDRFVRDEGYAAHVKKVVPILLKNTRLEIKDFSKVLFPVIDERDVRSMAGNLRLEPGQIQGSFISTVGNTGAALIPMLLVGALEEAKVQDRLMLINYGDGADVCVVQIKDGIEQVKSNRMGLKKHIESKMLLSNYGKYMKFRNIVNLEPSMEAVPRAALPNMWRERKCVYRFHGFKCNKCGKVQFPRQKYCIFCHADEKELAEIPLADRKGVLITYTLDERAPVIDPPNVLAAVNIEGGGRFFSQMTDRDTTKLKPGIEMEFTFRKIHEGLGVHNYFWKCKPSRSL